MISAIVIQSTTLEINNQRLEWFLDLNKEKLLNCGIPIFLFIDRDSKEIIERATQLDQKIKDLKIQSVFVETYGQKNPTTYVLYNILNFKTNEFPKILLLESDVILKDGFVNTLNQNIKNKKFWVYGSRYSGRVRNERLRHMNGVAIYNRCDAYLKFIKQAFIDEGGIDMEANYDLYMYNYIKNNNLDLEQHYLDSPYIIDLSPPMDFDVDYTKLKPSAVVVHQKFFIRNFLS
jgi:hypothetical protein